MFLYKEKVENCPRWRIEVPLTMLTSTFNLGRAMVVTHTHAKDQGQRSLGSTVRMLRDGWTDRRGRRLHYLPC